MLGLLAGDTQRSHIHQHEVIVGAAGHDPRAEPGQRLGHDRGVRDGAPLVVPECLLGGQLEGDGLARDDLHERTALDAREGGPVDGRGQRSIRSPVLDHWERVRVEPGPQRPSREDHPAARAAERLVRRRGHQVGVRERARVDIGGDETGDVGHIDEQDGADVLGDRRHPLEIPEPRIRRRAADDQLRPDVLRLGGHRVVVDPLRVLPHAIGMDLVQPAREIEPHPVREMATVGQVHAHDPVAGLEDAEVGDHVRLRTRVRLDVDVLGAGEEGERSVLGESLGDVNELAATVVALARQAFGVLVGEPGALRLHDGRRRVVLARDQLDLVVLAPPLTEHRLPQDRVELGDRLEGEPRRWRDRHERRLLPCHSGTLWVHRRRTEPPRIRRVSSHVRGRARWPDVSPADGQVRSGPRPVRAAESLDPRDRSPPRRRALA